MTNGVQWEKLARHLGETRSDPACPTCSGGGTAPDGTTCDCVGWYPRGSGESARKLEQITVERDALLAGMVSMGRARDDEADIVTAEFGVDGDLWESRCVPVANGRWALDQRVTFDTYDLAVQAMRALNARGGGGAAS